MPTFYNSKKDPAAAAIAQDEREVVQKAQELEENQSKPSKNNTPPSYVSRQN
jgi:hypothetical protein